MSENDEIRKAFEKETDWVDKYEQPMFMSVKYIHWLEAKVKQLREENRKLLEKYDKRDADARRFIGEIYEWKKKYNEMKNYELLPLRFELKELKEAKE